MKLKLFFQSIFSIFDHLDWKLLILIFIGIFGAILSSTPIRKGDATEYVLTTESLFFEHNIEYTAEKYFRHLTLKPASMDGVGYVRNKGLDGKEYLTQHPLYYSLSSVPLYGLFYFLNPRLAYWSFFITNLVMFEFVAIYLLYYFKKVIKADKYHFLFFAYIFFSTAFGYIFWHHPETFLYFTVASFFFFLFILNKPIISSIFLGLTIGQSLVMAFLGLNLLWYLLERKLLLKYKTLLIGGIIFGISSFHYFCSYRLTGEFFPLQDNAKFTITALKDVIPALIDPGVGLIWFYPMVIFTLLFAKRNLRSVIVYLSVFLTLTAFMINRQFYTHQIGLRYHNYLYPAFFFILDPLLLRTRKKLQFFLIAISAFLTIGINIDIRTNNDSMNISAKNFVGYEITKRLFPFRYQEHPAVFINHTYYLTDYINEITEHDPQKTKVYIEGDNYYFDINYFYGNKWIRTLFTPLKTGTLRIEFIDPKLSVQAKIGNTTYTATNGIIEIPLDDSNLKSSMKGDMYVDFTRYAYIDWFFEGKCACEKYPEDTRLIGNSIKEAKLNKLVFYPPEYIRSIKNDPLDLN